MGLRFYPIYFASSLGRLRQKCIVVKLIPAFFLFFEIWQILWCYKRVPPSTSNRSWKYFYYARFVVFFIIIMPTNFFSTWRCFLGSNRKRKESSPTEKSTRLDVTLYLILSRTHSTRTQRANKWFKQIFVALKSCSSICCRAKTCYKRVPHSKVFKNRKWTYGLQSKHTSTLHYVMFSSAQKYKICMIKNILAFLICKICCLLCIFMSKSSSNTMGFQLFNVLFNKVGGTRPVTGLTVQ